jgi:hypothetical protein
MNHTIPGTPVPGWTPQLIPESHRRGRKVVIWIAVAIGGLFLIGSLAGPSSSDATDDASVTMAAQADALGFRPGVVHITNSSSSTSDYYVEVAILDSDGDNIGWTNATANHVEPGQHARADITVTELGAAKVEVTKVQRTAA